MSEEESRKRGNNARNISTWQTLVPIYFNEEISFQKPFEDREIIIKVIETDVIAIKAKTESFQVVNFYAIVNIDIVLFPLGNALNYWIFI